MPRRRVKEALRDLYGQAASGNRAEDAQAALMSWMSWARQSRIDPFNERATIAQKRMAGVVREQQEMRALPRIHDAGLATHVRCIR